MRGPTLVRVCGTGTAVLYGICANVAGSSTNALTMALSPMFRRSKLKKNDVFFPIGPPKFAEYWVESYAGASVANGLFELK